jgi:hypothetical protein
MVGAIQRRPGVISSGVRAQAMWQRPFSSLFEKESTAGLGESGLSKILINGIGSYQNAIIFSRSSNEAD